MEGRVESRDKEEVESLITANGVLTCETKTEEEQVAIDKIMSACN